MTQRQFFLSDPHFGHGNIISFKDDKGNLIRPFHTIEEHDELIVENCNKTVRPHDRLYIMGDVVINKRNLPILDRINGKKVLIKGNHDIFPLKTYMPYFEDFRAYKIYPQHGFIFSHIPIHPCQLTGRFKKNFHGHIHQNNITISYFYDENDRLRYSHDIDDRYINLCVEKINYIPISLDEIITKHS